MKRLKLIVLISCLISTVPGIINAMAVFTVEMGETELEFEFELFYTALGWYFPLTSLPIPDIESEKEGDIYLFLAKRFLKPRYLVIEGSIYPLPMVGVGINKWLPEFYEWSTVFAGFNVIESLTTGPFMEPWATSVFWGNVANFKPKTGVLDTNENTVYTEEYDGKGYSGLLISYGNLHIKHCELIADHWLEIELKLKGEKSARSLLMSWNYKIGGRIHFNPEIKSYVYVGFKRENMDANFYRFSIAKNSFIEAKMDFEVEEKFQPLRLLFLIGKKFPLRNTQIVPELKIGFIYHFNDPYSGSLADLEDNFRFLVSPNVRF